MAMTYQNFASLGVNLNRQKYGPLDISNVFTSAADLKYYLTKGAYTEGVSEYWYKNANEKIVPYPYEGQVLATVIDGVVEVFVLALDVEGNFETREIGAKVEVDGKTIVKGADGKLSIVAPVNPDDKKTYNFAYANGVYSWVEVDTATAAGQAQAIQGLTDRTVALEEAVNGKGEGEERIAGLVEKVAALEAVDTATQAELDAYKEVVTDAIATALAEAKKYADDNDANTEYDDTELVGRVAAIEADYLKEEDKYDDTELAGRVTIAEGKITTLEGNVSDNATAIATEKSRAEAAEKALGERIDAIDFVDEDELAEALEPITTELATKATQTDLTALQARVEAFLDNTGAATEAIDTLQDLINYIETHDDADISGILADIQAIEDKLAGIDSTVAAYVTAAVEALNIGDYAKASELAALASRVVALEGKPFDSYATKTEVQDVDAKFAQYTTTELLNTQLAGKVDSSAFETFKGDNTTAINDAKAAAIAAAKTETETQIAAFETTVVDTYATKAALTEAVEGIENDLTAYAKTADVNAELAKKVENASIAHAVAADPDKGIEAIPEGVTKEGTTLKIVVDAPTRAETAQMIADKVAAVTGGESAAAVKLLVEAETERSTAKDEAHDTAIAKLNGEATVAGSVAEAKALAQKGVNDAAAVASDLDAAELLIAGNAREIETVKGTITTVNETLSGKVTTLENKDIEIAGLISGLDTTVKSHTETITQQGTKLAALENEDLALAALIQGNTNKFADYSTATQMNAAIEAAIAGADLSTYAKKSELEAIYKAGEGEAAASGILAVEIERAKAAEKANADAISALIGEDANKTIRTIAAEETAAIVAGADTKYDTLKEIADFIMNDETGAAAMANDIADLKTVVGDEESGLVKAVADNADAIAAIVQPMESSEISVATTGELGIKEVNVNKLVQTEGDVLILNGGNA